MNEHRMPLAAALLALTAAGLFSVRPKAAAVAAGKTAGDLHPLLTAQAPVVVVSAVVCPLLS